MEIGGLFASAFISSTIAPGGSEAVLALMVAEQKYGVEFLVLIATIGNTLGALTTWWLGRFTASKYSAAQRLTKKKQQSIQTVQTWGAGVLLFSWLPVIGDAFCFAAGWLQLPLLVSTIGIVIGKALRYIFVAYLFA